MLKQNFDEALSMLDDLEGKLPEGKVDLLRANIYHKLENFSMAEETYRSLIERDFAKNKATFNLALTLFKQGRLDDARELYAQVEEACKESDPELSARAETAGKIIRSHRDSLMRSFAKKYKEHEEKPSEGGGE
jgi:tetratricopeptide (TPR) repeat protein